MEYVCLIIESSNHKSMEKEKTIYNNFFERIEYSEKENNTLEEQSSYARKDYCNLMEGKITVFHIPVTEPGKIQFLVSQKQAYARQIIESVLHKKNDTGKTVSNVFMRIMVIIKNTLPSQKKIRIIFRS
jgi:hypothetical protein